MTHTNADHANTNADALGNPNSPFAHGHTIAALDRLIHRDLNDHDHAVADLHLSALADLTHSIDSLTDAEARNVLAGVLHAMTLDHIITREEATHPSPQPEPIADTTCGHRHTISHYANGCAHATHSARAITAAHNGNHKQAQHHAAIADRILWPLDDLNNPESLRDFIAGTTAGLETHLRSLGTPINQ